MNALVIPTNSAERLSAWLQAWAPWPWDVIIVVQDEPELSLSIPDELADEAATRLRAFSWREIDATLPEPAVISRRDSAIRSFGFWQAWLAGAEIIFTVDDDCYPTADDLVAGHRGNLYGTPLWTSSVPGMRVRGLPYRRLGVLHDVQISMGLWTGTPDLDAISTLAGTGHDGVVSAQTRVMSPHQLFPMSGMNLAFRRDVACLMYFAPMGLGQPFGRFDDIWCGILAQRICRHLGYSIVAGHPYVDHRRASDPFRNLVKEAPGIAANEHLWEALVALRWQADTPLECMREAGAALGGHDDAYVAQWGERIESWCGLFERAPEPVSEYGLTSA